MTEKTKLITPRLPRGFEDRTSGEIAAVGAMIDKIKAVYEYTVSTPSRPRCWS